MGVHVGERAAHIHREVGPVLPVVGSVHEVEETGGNGVAVAVAEDNFVHCFFLLFFFLVLL